MLDVIIGIIESLEDKFEDSKQEMLMKERSRLAEFDKLERNYSQQLQEVNTAKDDVEDELREEIRKHRNEVDMNVNKSASLQCYHVRYPHISLSLQKY